MRSRVDYQVNNDVALAYIAGYSRFNGSSTFDQDGGANPATSFTTVGGPGNAGYQANNTVWSKYKNYSHELEIMSTGKREVDWLLGLYYANEDNGIRFDIPIMNGTEIGTVSWQGSFIQPKETVDSKAAFGQATWNLSDQWHLTGGFRYTSDKRENIGGLGNGWSNYDTVPQVPVSPSMNPLVPGGNNGFTPYSFNSGSYSDSKLTGLARVTYDIDKNNMVFASVSTGYKSGGLQDGGRPYGAETLTNYEIGSKSTFLGGKVRMNNSAYYSKFKDFQFSAPVTNPDGTRGLATNNAEGATVWGLETEIAAKITPEDRVQFTAAYKERGALNRLLTLTAEERARGVIAASAGNHAQGLAYHARRLGIPATIVMPRFTPIVKVQQTESHDANVVLFGEKYDDASAHALELAEKKGLVYVHPFDDAKVMAGQGTVGLEMLEDVPELDTLVVPIGGGGLISGIATVAKAQNREISVIGVQAELYPSMYAAMKGQSATCDGDTLAEGIAVKAPGRITTEIVRELVDDIVLVSEDQIERAVATLISIEKTVVEGAGAAGLAAVLAPRGINPLWCDAIESAGRTARAGPHRASRPGRTNRPTVDSGRRHAHEDAAVEAGVAGLESRIEGPAIEEFHDCSFPRVRGRCSRFSDVNLASARAETSAAGVCLWSGRRIQAGDIHGRLEHVPGRSGRHRFLGGQARRSRRAGRHHREIPAPGPARAGRKGLPDSPVADRAHEVLLL